MYPIVASLMEKLNLDEEVIEMMYQSAKEDIGLDAEYSTSILTTLKTRLNALTVKETKLLDTFLERKYYKGNLRQPKPLKFKMKKR